METSACLSTNPKFKNQKGQATLEFALTLILMMGFVFFIIQLSLVFAWGSYIQYATHMAARAYLSSGLTKEDQMDRAKRVIYRSLKRGESRGDLDRLPFLAQGIGGAEPRGLSFDHSRFNPSIRSLSWLEGVRYSFRSRVFLLPLGRLFLGPQSDGGVNSLTLTSESWLGREPSTQECLEQVRSRYGGIVDNGC